MSGIEEQFFYQKSRIQWLKLGDRNTSFYHNISQSRNSRNAIRKLTTAGGDMITEPVLIKIEAACHFQNFMQNVPDGVAEVDLEALSRLVQYKCSR